MALSAFVNQVRAGKRLAWWLETLKVRCNQRGGGFQETQTYQALNDSGDSCLRRFARKQAVIYTGIAETPVW